MRIKNPIKFNEFSDYKQRQTRLENALTNKGGPPTSYGGPPTSYGGGLSTENRVPGIYFSFLNMNKT